MDLTGIFRMKLKNIEKTGRLSYHNKRLRKKAFPRWTGFQWKRENGRDGTTSGNQEGNKG